MVTNFLTKLRRAQEQRDSWLCIGLEPGWDQLPAGVDLLMFSQQLIEATTEFASAYRIGLSFYLTHENGLEVLGQVIKTIPDDIPIILDGKFGSVGDMASHEARLAYQVLGVDAVTVNPYAGADVVIPFLCPDKTVFVLIRSGNTTASDFQLWPNEQAPFFRYVAAQCNTLAGQYPGQMGLEVAATQPRDLARIRSWVPKLPFLIPGGGVRGSDLTQSIKKGITQDGIGPLMSVSRSIIYASRTSDFADAAHTAAHDWVQHIRSVKATYRGDEAEQKMADQ
jgi:orotidine 5'-phosphate decarboxylase subfamily 2